MATTTTRRRDLDETPSTQQRQFISSLISKLAQAQASSFLNPLANDDPAVKHILLTLHALFPNELLPALDILDRRLVLRCILSQDEKNDQAHNRSECARLDDPNHQDRPRADATMDSDQAPGAFQNPHQEDKRLLEIEARTQASGLTSELTSSIAPLDLHIQADAKTREHVALRPAEPSINSLPTIKPSISVFYVRSNHLGQTKSRWKAESTSHYEVRLLPWSCSCPAFAFSAFPGTTQHASTPGYPHRVGGLSLGDHVPTCKHILACLLVDRCHQFAQFAEDTEMNAQEIAGWAAGYGD